MLMRNRHEIRKLNRLLELDYDAIEAYEAAIDGLMSPVNKKALRVYCDDHRRHTEVLTQLITALGGKPARGPDWMQLLTKGKVQIARLLGGDRAILIAMRINEEVTNRRYELAIALGGVSAASLQALQGNLADERLHRLWIARRLEGATDAASAPLAPAKTATAARRKTPRKTPARRVKNSTKAA
jgi:hypothetical protein